MRLSGPLSKQKACELVRTQGTDCTPSEMAGCPDGRPGTSFLKSMGRSRMRTSDLASAIIVYLFIQLNLITNFN